MNCGPLFFTMFLQFIEVCLCTALLRSRRSISVGLRSGLWPGRCNTSIFLFLSCSVVDLLLCLELLSCCMTQVQHNFSCHIDVLTFDSTIFWYSGELTIDLHDSKVPRSCICKTSQKHHPSTTVLELVWGVCADMLCLVFPKHGAVHYSQIAALWSHLSKEHCSRSPQIYSDAIS